MTHFSDWLALLWGTAIGFLSLAPVATLPTVPVSDKLEHFIAYGLLAMLGCIARRSKRDRILVVLAVVIYGGAIEVCQPYFNRHMELGDLIANAGGAVAGAMVVFISKAIIVESR